MADKDHEDGSQVSKVSELVGGGQRASQPPAPKGDSETQQRTGPGTPRRPQPAGLQCPGAIREEGQGLQDGDGHRAR